MANKHEKVRSLITHQGNTDEIFIRDTPLCHQNGQNEKFSTSYGDCGATAMSVRRWGWDNCYVLAASTKASCVHSL